MISYRNIQHIILLPGLLKLHILHFQFLIIYTHYQEKFSVMTGHRWEPNSVLIILHGRIFHRLVPGSVHFKHIVPIPGSHSYRDTVAVTKLYWEMRANHINTLSSAELNVSRTPLSLVGFLNVHSLYDCILTWSLVYVTQRKWEWKETEYD